MLYEVITDLFQQWACEFCFLLVQQQTRQGFGGQSLQPGLIAVFGVEMAGDVAVDRYVSYNFV